MRFLAILVALVTTLLAGTCTAQELGSSMILRKSEFISSQLAKMTESEKALYRCPGQDSSAPVFNTFPVMYETDEPSLCKNFPIIDHALVEGDPKYTYFGGESGKSYRSGEMIVVLVHLINTAKLGVTSDAQTTAKNVTMEMSLDYNAATQVSIIFKAENMKVGKRAGTGFGSQPGCHAILLPNSGSVYDYKGFRIGSSRQNIKVGKFSLGDIAPGWEHSRFITFLFRVYC